MDRVLGVADGGNRAGAAIGGAHQRRAHLNRPVGAQRRSASRIEQLERLHHHDRGLHGFDRTVAALQCCACLLEGAEQCLAMAILLLEQASTSIAGAGVDRHDGVTHSQPLRWKNISRAMHVASMLPSPMPQNAHAEPMCLTRKPKFCPKKPVMKASGRKIVAITVSCFMTSFCRLLDRKSTRLNSSHANISYAVFCLKKKKQR